MSLLNKCFQKTSRKKKTGKITVRVQNRTCSSIKRTTLVIIHFKRTLFLTEIAVT